MIWHHDPCRAVFPRPGAKRWDYLSWEAKRFAPKYLVSAQASRLRRHGEFDAPVVGFRDIARTTDERTVIACVLARAACGNKVPLLRAASSAMNFSLGSVLASIAFDWLDRARQGAASVNFYVLEDSPLPSPDARNSRPSDRIALRLGLAMSCFAPEWTILQAPVRRAWRSLWALTEHERLRLRAMLDAIVASLYGLTWDDLAWILRDCDHPLEVLSQRTFKRDLDPKGFWRVDQDRDPEFRHTVLSLVALRDLEQAIAACGGDRERGIEAFCSQNDGDGWKLPEAVRLADFGLGHDERARQPQPVRERMGERFLPWQLEQSVEESWEECRWHARNILGEQGYDRLQRQLRGEELEDLPLVAEGAPPGYPGGQERLIPAEQPNLFGGEFEDLPSKGRRKRR